LLKYTNQLGLKEHFHKQKFKKRAQM